MGKKTPSVTVMCKLVRLSSVHTFTFCCCLGGLMMALVGAIGWASVVEEKEYSGTCSLAGTTGICQCATYERSGVGSLCVAVEAAFPNVVYQPFDNTIIQTRCLLKLGDGSLSSCIDTSVNLPALSITNITTPPAMDVPCKLHGINRNCFLESESLPGHQNESYFALLIGGAIWGGLCFLLLLLSFALEGYKAGFSYVNLMNDFKDTIDENNKIECDFMSGNTMSADLPGDVVAVKTSGEWKVGEVHSRKGHKYDVKCDGEMLHDVKQSEIRPANLKEGMWVVTAELFHDIPSGVMGTVHDIGQGAQVKIAGNSYPVEVGKLIPTPPILIGQTVEVRDDACDAWKEGIVDSVHAEGIVKVSLSGEQESNPYIWIRRPYGLQVESRIMNENNEPQDGTFVFVDPGSSLAPTSMTAAEVKLYGGIREVSDDIANYRSNLSSRVLGSTAVLGAAHLVTQHLNRQERTLNQVCTDEITRKRHINDDDEESQEDETVTATTPDEDAA